jgi:hypothetical protein
MRIARQIQAQNEDKHVDKNRCKLRHALLKQQEQAQHSGEADGKHNEQEYLKTLGVQGQFQV